MSTAQERRIPTLDGLRALSIALVMGSHLLNDPSFALSRHDRDLVTSTGVFGVQVFFVISGYLITRLLLAEHERTGTISLSHFYFRRTLRIFPPFYVYIGVIAILATAGLVHTRPNQLLIASTYLTNYETYTNPKAYDDYVTGHMWSLAVEEQFYLLWPAVVLVFAWRRAIWCAVGVILVTPVCAFIEAHFHLFGGFTFESVSAVLAAGCLLALLEQKYPVLVQRVFSRRRTLVLGIIIALSPLTWMRALPPRWWIFFMSIIGIGVSLIVGWTVRNSRSVVSRALDSAPLVYAGQLSYSLYLWQQPFCYGGNGRGWWGGFPLNVVYAIAAALTSFYLVERPSLRWRSRLERQRKAAAIALQA